MDGLLVSRNKLTADSQVEPQGESGEATSRISRSEVSNSRERKMSAKRQRHVVMDERHDSCAHANSTVIQLALLPPHEIDTNLDSRDSWAGSSPWGYLFLP